MASADWSKVKTTGEAKAIMRHSEKEERLSHEHSNQDIDKTLTANNVSLEGLSYKERCDKYDARIQELATNSRMRKDTVTMLCIEIPVPNEIDIEDQKDFARRAYEIVGDVVGKENLIDADFHCDEQHVYIDSKTHEERLSMNHLHVFVTPGVSDGVSERLCAKELCTRARMIQLNNNLEEMAQNEFGVRFLTGEGTKSRDSVESLKLASEKARIEQRNERASERHAKAWQRECAVEERELAVLAREKALNEREKGLDEREARIDNLETLQAEIMTLKRVAAKVPNSKFEKHVNEASTSLRDVLNKAEALNEYQNEKEDYQK